MKRNDITSSYQGKSHGLDVIWEWGRLDMSVYHRMTEALKSISYALEKSIGMKWFNPLRIYWIINIHINSFQLRRLYIYLNKLKKVYLLHMDLPIEGGED